MAKLVTPFELWPLCDRQLWEAGLEPTHLLDGPSYGAGLSATTLRNARRGYGRWLAALAAEGELNHQQAPEARVTPARVRLFLRTLRTAGNLDNTVCARMWELRTALRFMVPHADLRWLTAPGGHDLRATLRVAPQPTRAHSSVELLGWGKDLMGQARFQKTPLRRARWYRDGLLISLFALRAPRLRSMTALRMDQHLLHQESGYRLVLGTADTKTRRRLEYDLPAGLVPAMNHYLAVERVLLLAGERHDRLWVGTEGKPLQDIAIAQIVIRRSKVRFGESFGPHRFRHAAATTMALAASTSPGAVAAMLGSSANVVEKHYNRGDQVTAAGRFQQGLGDQRQASRALAEAAFKR